jgi:hypothetical protein
LTKAEKEPLIRGEIALELIKFIRSPQESSKVIGSLYSKSTKDGEKLSGFQELITKIIKSDELTMNWKVIFLQNLKSEKQCFAYHESIDMHGLEAEFKKLIATEAGKLSNKDYLRYRDSIEHYT